MTLMRSALGLLEEGVTPSDSWPDRGDTREFKPITGEHLAGGVPEAEPVDVEEPRTSRDFNWG